MISSQDLLTEFDAYAHVETKPFVIDLEKCEGMWLVTLEGRRIFDWCNFHASRLLGYNHPKMSDPAYLKKICIAANNKPANPDHVTPELVAYHRRLHRLAPACMRNSNLRTYTSNSGAEAVENALKHLINVFYKRPNVIQHAYGRSRPHFVSFEKGFHGRTVYALHATHMPHNATVTRDYQGLVIDPVRLPFPACDNDVPYSDNLREMERCITQIEDSIAANHECLAGILVEPIQGAGGHRVALPEFFRHLSRISSEWNVLLCFDEVQTAGGQTGAVFMCDQLNLPFPPDAVATAKKFGCGVTYVREHMEERNIIDSTWSGHLVDMIRFVQETDVVHDEELIEKVPMKATWLNNALRDLQAKYPSLLSNIRGEGLYLGFTLQLNKNQFIQRALEQEDLLLMGAGTDTVRLRPNLNVSLQDIQELHQKLNRLFATANQG